MKTITAVIPVKKNSSRLENKNIMPFAGTNLLIHKIRQLKNVPQITEILVSTDSEEMLAIAKAEGVRGLRRPIEYSNETRPFSDFITYITENVSTDMILWACVTSPLVDEKLYTEIINTYFEKQEDYDSVITVFPFKHFLMDEDGPFNFKRGEKHVNSQDLPELYVFTNGAILSDVANMRIWKYHFGSNPYYFLVTREQSIDIDDIQDYKVAQLFYEELRHND